MGKTIESSDEILSHTAEEVRGRLHLQAENRKNRHKSFKELWDLAGSTTEPVDDADAFISDARSVWGANNSQ